MREILFRGKLIKNGEWVYGLLWKKKYDDGNRIFISYFPYKDDGEERDVVRIETVGQFTGLTDKNGNKIFEGDILSGLFSHSEPINGVVTFQDGAFGVKFRACGAERYTAFTSFCNVKFEIIGNIHDNPELVGG